MRVGQAYDGIFGGLAVLRRRAEASRTVGAAATVLPLESAKVDGLTAMCCGGAWLCDTIAAIAVRCGRFWVVFLGELYPC